MKNAIYVKCQDSGRVLVQADADNQFGFVLADEDQTWPGGFGSGVHRWKAIAEEDVSEEDIDRLGWMIEESAE